MRLIHSIYTIEILNLQRARESHEYYREFTKTMSICLIPNINISSSTDTQILLLKVK